MGSEPVPRLYDVIPYMPLSRIDDDTFEPAEGHIALADDYDIVERPDWRFDFCSVEMT